tara:strand:+ start:3837 stop:4589 length:753 start_codon:yes stop_codon:yes gene_type:complete
MRVYETKDYKRFELISANRPIDYRKVSRMREEVKRKNLASAYMIIVNSKDKGKEMYKTDGTKYPIVDGQHRFLSCKAEGKKIYYIVNDDITLDDIPRAASMQNSWKIKDYIHHYTERGYSEYKAFNGYMIRNGFPPSVTMIILLGGRGRYASKALKSGELKVTTNWNVANKFAEAVHQLGDFIKFNKHARFVEAFWVMFNNEEYSHRRMMAKIEYLSSYIKRSPDRGTYLSSLEYVYNYKSRDKVRFVEE